MNELGNAIWELLNTPAVITLVVGLLAIALNKLWSKQPKWREYEGTIVTAIKLAEKAVPDKTVNAGLARLNNALQYVVAIFEEYEHRKPKQSEVDQIEEAIQVKHAELEAMGVLRSEKPVESK